MTRLVTVLLALAAMALGGWSLYVSGQATAKADAVEAAYGGAAQPLQPASVAADRLAAQAQARAAQLSAAAELAASRRDLASPPLPSLTPAARTPQARDDSLDAPSYAATPPIAGAVAPALARPPAAAPALAPSDPRALGYTLPQTSPGNALGPG